MAATPTPAGPRRADHVRNRMALLQAAREVFAERGADAPISAVVCRAGVAKGTFFRHFATKEMLVQALLADRLGRLGAIAREVNETCQPGWRAVAVMMERILGYVVADRSLADFVERGQRVPGTPEIAAAREALLGEVGRGVRAAQAAGQIRPDVTASDFPAIVMMISRSVACRPARDARLGQRYLRLFLDGIRAPGASDGDFEGR